MFQKYGNNQGDEELFPEEYILNYGRYFEISLKSENIEKLFEIIDYTLSVEKDLPTREGDEFDYDEDEEDFDYDDYGPEDYDDYGNGRFEDLDYDEAHRDGDYVDEDIGLEKIRTILDSAIGKKIDEKEDDDKLPGDDDDTDLIL